MVFDAADAITRLAQLGLKVEYLTKAVSAGLTQAFQCTELAPSNFKGLVAWGYTAEALALETVKHGWKPNNKRNYTTVVHPDGTYAVAVSSGDSNTGILESTSATRTEKGPATEAAIANNQLGFWQFDPTSPPPPQSKLGFCSTIQIRRQKNSGLSYRFPSQ